MKKTTILFTGAGRRIELITAVREASLTEGIPLSIIGADMAREAPVLSFCVRVRQVVPISDPSYIEELLAICGEEAVDLLIPTIDTDLLLLSQNRERFLAQGTRVLISEEEKIRLCRDKNLTGDFFAGCGLKAPATVHDIAAYAGPFPAFIKPKDGSSSIGAHRAETEEALAHYARELDDYVIQPLIEGEEYTIDICCDFEGHTISIVPRIRQRVRAGEVLQTKIVMDDALIRASEEVIRAFRPCGPITVQAIRHKETGEDYFIEINPRFGGGSPLSMAAGADSARAILRLLAGKEPERYPFIEDGAVYNRFDRSVKVTAGVKRPKVEGVIFDLDDTLYREKDFVRSGYAAVASYLGEEAYAEVMWRYFEAGLPAIDRLLSEIGKDHEKEACLRVYRTHEKGYRMYPGAEEMLLTLRDLGIRTGIITDGREETQQAKIRAFDLRDRVDDVIITDALGGEQFRKPCDIAYRILQRKWRIPFSRMMYVGDNADKDFGAVFTLSMQGIFLRNKDGVHDRDSFDDWTQSHAGGRVIRIDHTEDAFGAVLRHILGEDM